MSEKILHLRKIDFCTLEGVLQWITCDFWAILGIPGAPKYPFFDDFTPQIAFKHLHVIVKVVSNQVGGRLKWS